MKDLIIKGFAKTHPKMGECAGAWDMVRESCKFPIGFAALLMMEIIKELGHMVIFINMMKNIQKE